MKQPSNPIRPDFLSELAEGKGKLRSTEDDDSSSASSSSSYRLNPSLVGQIADGRDTLRSHKPSRMRQQPKPDKPMSELEKRIVAQRNMIRQNSDGSSGWSDSD